MHFFEDFHDMALVSRARVGDMAALALLIQLYQRVLYTVALGMLGDATEAREATRTAFVRTYDRLSLTDPDYGFFSATHRLLVCECLEVLRRRPLRPATSVPGAGASAGVAEAGGEALPARGMTVNERRRQIHGAMLQLTPEARAIVILRHLAGLSYDETALTLGLPTAMVRTRLHAARQQLGEWLLAWPARATLHPEEDALLQGSMDGALDYYECEARDRLLEQRTEASMRAVALNELGHLLNSLGPADPPGDLALQVLSQIEALSEPAERPERAARAGRSMG
jgi:RNA polymerase sigma-70 factor (ECF subfamily)